MTRIERVEPIPGADRIAVAHVDGWQVVVPKDTEPGTFVIFVPPDYVIPQDVSDAWGITKYLDKGRVRAIKLMKGTVASLGVAIEPSGADWARITAAGIDVSEGLSAPSPNVAAVFGITKYVPSFASRTLRGPGGKGRSNRYNESLFAKYTDIENLRHFVSGFVRDELVVVTEKIHGANSRAGRIDGRWVAGSHRVQRLHPSQSRIEPAPSTLLGRLIAELKRRFMPDTAGKLSRTTLLKRTAGTDATYWYPFTVPGVRDMVYYLSESLGKKQAIVYGEIFGPGIQKGFDYGVEPGKLGYRVFDIMLDGQYLDWWETFDYCRRFGVEAVPVLHVGPYDPDQVAALSTGLSTIGGSHIREGVVIRTPVNNPLRGPGRSILKLISTDYLTERHGDDQNDQDVAAEERAAA